MIVQTIDKRTNADVGTSDMWRLPPANLALNDAVTDVWLASLNAENADESERILSDDERERAARFRFAPDRKHFVSARSRLRIILGKYLHLDPCRIVFAYNKYGKPSIGCEARTDIKFNVSHSGNLALFAFARAREIGVDIERVNTNFVDEAMVRECLTRREIERFRALDGIERERFFFDCWTRKEALVKACGKGLSLAANRIETDAFAESPAVLGASVVNLVPTLWFVQRLLQISGFAAALAIEDARPRLRFWRQTKIDLLV